VFIFIQQLKNDHQFLVLISSILNVINTTMNILCRDNMIQHLHGELNAHQSLIIQLKQQVSTLEMELAKKV